jgi:plasmid segregation protein ParM
MESAKGRRGCTVLDGAIAATVFHNYPRNHMLSEQPAPHYVSSVGIDLGYSFTKVAFVKNGALQRFAFPSLSIPGTRKSLAGFSPFEDQAAAKLLEVDINGVCYLAGPDILRHASSHMTRSVDPAFCESMQYEAIMRCALQMLGAREIGTLVLGLPPLTYNERRESLVRRFTGNIPLRSGLPVSVHKVQVVLQPLGALFSNGARSLASSSHDTVLVVDAGYLTVDQVVVRDMQVQTARSGGQAVGMSTVLERLLSQIGADLGRNLDTAPFRDRLDDSLTSGRVFKVDGSPVDLARYKELVRHTLTGALDGIVGRAGSISDIDSVVVAGGAGQLFEPGLRRRFPDRPVALIADARFAVAEGFLNIGDVLSKRGGINGK